MAGDKSGIFPSEDSENVNLIWSSSFGCSCRTCRQEKLVIQEISGGEECKKLHLLAPTSTIHQSSTLAAFNFPVGGIFAARRKSFQQMRGCWGNFQSDWNCPKMSQIICSAATWTIHWRELLVHPIFNLSISCILKQHFLFLPHDLLNLVGGIYRIYWDFCCLGQLNNSPCHWVSESVTNYI